MIATLESEPRSGGVRIRIDGRPWVTVSAQDVVELGLVDGCEVSQAQHTELSGLADVFSARVVALKMLSNRSLPSREIFRRLIRKGHEKAAADRAVAALVASGLINDAEFARHHARTRARRRLGPGRLIAELRRFGISERDAEGAVAEVMEREGVDTRAQMREAAMRKASTLKNVDPDSARRRLRAFLLRRGYSGPEVRSAINEALA